MILFQLTKYITQVLILSVLFNPLYFLSFIFQSCIFLSCIFSHPADYAVARCPSVCPSVRPCDRPSTVLRQTVKHIIKLLHRRIAIAFQLFRTKRYGSTPTGASSGDVECGGAKNRDFQPISRFISETIRDRVIVPMECKQKTVSNLSNGTIFNYLE